MGCAADRKLVMLRGNSGSGKTTVARFLQHLIGRGTLVVSQDVVRRDMGELRGSCDRAEVFVPEDVWPIPTYTDLVHYV